MTDTNRPAPPHANGNSKPGPKPGKRARTAARLSDARDAAGDAALRAVEVIEGNPMSVLVGGLALGVIAGALIPRTDREKDALAPIGKRLAKGATAAFTAVKATGREQLSASMMSRDAAREGARKVLSSALSAAKEASAKPTPPKAPRNKPRAPDVG